MRVEKNPFAPRTSYLDPSASESALQLSEFRGFFNLVAMMAAFYIFCTNASFFLRHGTLVGLRTLVKLIPLDMLTPWCLLGASSFSAFFLEWAWVRWTARCRAAGRPPPSAWCRFVLQHSIQTAIFLSTLYLLVFAKDWPVVPTGTFLLHMIVLVMKMHSYLATNAEFAASAASLAEAKPSSAAGEASGDQLLPAGAPTLRRRTVPSEERNDAQSVKEEEDTKRCCPGMSGEEKGLLSYPENVTLGNYFYFLCAPTLVYELNYPRTERIRWSYVLEKCIAAVGVFSVLHIVINQHITPILLSAPILSPIEAVASLIIPFVFCNIMIFYMMFELILNGLAEITRFADRCFYDDWWNSTTWDEYARKWNKPVHEWLLRHVYLESLNTYKTSRMRATFITFLTSAILHETVFAVVFRMVRPYLFMLQMAQLPLIYLGRKLKNTRAGNFFFWFGIILGVPLLATLYCREYYYALSLKNHDSFDI